MTNFDSTKHPRNQAGTSKGGQFAQKHNSAPEAALEPATSSVPELLVEAGYSRALAEALDRFEPGSAEHELVVELRRVVHDKEAFDSVTWPFAEYDDPFGGALEHHPRLQSVGPLVAELYSSGQPASRAADWLQSQGHQVLARNFETHAGTIDLVTREGNRVVFSKVLEGGFEEASPTLVARQYRLAAIWMQAHKEFGAFRIDLIDANPDHGEITRLENVG